jgi:hypothetical protein
VALVQEQIRQVGSDETCSTGDERLHDPPIVSQGEMSMASQGSGRALRLVSNCHRQPR